MSVFLTRPNKPRPPVRIAAVILQTADGEAISFKVDPPAEVARELRGQLRVDLIGERAYITGTR